MTGAVDQSVNIAASADTAHVEYILRHLLARHLGVAEDMIDPHQSFDEMGMDSIDGVLLSGELSDRLGIDLPPEFLLKYRSLDHVQEGLLALHGDGARSPGQAKEIRLFVFAGGAGRYTKMSRFAEYDARLIVEVVPLGEWRDWLVAGCDFSSLVDRACDWIEERQPAGALTLGGHSLGGQIAFAVALALRARGREVDGLYVFDSSAERRKTGIARARAVVIWKLTKLRRRSARLGDEADAVDAREQAVENDVPGQAGIVLKVGVELLEFAPARALLIRWPGDRLPSMTDRRGVLVDKVIRMKLLDVMWRQWATQISPGEGGALRVTLFRALSPGSPDLGWLGLCPSLRIVRVDGRHSSMLESLHIQNLTAKLLNSITADGAGRG